MKWMVLRIIMIALGIAIFALEIILELDGTVGFLLATIGLSLIIIGLSIKGILNLFANIL